MGGLLIIYTVSGGVKAISYTQTQQLIIIFLGMFLAGYMVVHLLPEEISFSDSLKIAGNSGKLNIITTGITEDGFNWKDKYNIFSGIIGGFFLALSYFGTDQSQVGRYLTAPNISESRNGLLMNGFVKIPMQFLILLIGSLVFSFYSIYQAPVHFNSKLVTSTLQGDYGNELQRINTQYDSALELRKPTALALVNVPDGSPQHPILQNQLNQLNHQTDSIRKEAAVIIKKANPGSDASDTNYIFLHFVIHHLPRGLVGLLIAIIFLAAWGSIAAA
jgi:Na+/proline symporter